MLIVAEYKGEMVDVGAGFVRALTFSSERVNVGRS